MSLPVKILSLLAALDSVGNSTVLFMYIEHGHTNAEMPTSGNLKSGDSFFCISPPKINDQPLPLPHHKHNSIQSLIGSGHYMKSCMSYRPSQLAFMILSVMKYVRKYPRNRTLNDRKFEFWEKMG